jgi:ABC-type multidrug transport system fused ATPase/permease subunit
LARALYHRPRVLILDEATSALDGITEEKVFKQLVKLSGDMTVIAIAHRLSTVRACDRIYLMENGKVAAAGSYDQLFSQSALFRGMAEPATPSSH